MVTKQQMRPTPFVIPFPPLVPLAPSPSLRPPLAIPEPQPFANVENTCLCVLKKKTVKDGPMNWRTKGRTNSHIKMRGRFWKLMKKQKWVTIFENKISIPWANDFFPGDNPLYIWIFLFYVPKKIQIDMIQAKIVQNVTIRDFHL